MGSCSPFQNRENAEGAGAPGGGPHGKKRRSGSAGGRFWKVLQAAARQRQGFRRALLLHLPRRAPLHSPLLPGISRHRRRPCLRWLRPPHPPPPPGPRRPLRQTLRHGRQDRLPNLAPRTLR